MKINSQSRRAFIRNTSLAAVTLPFFGVPLTRTRAAESDKRLGFALVGLGNLSTGQLAPALQKTRHCRLAAVVTGTPAKAEKWKAQHNIPERNIYSYDTMERMADNPDIDVVYVVTPNALHAEHTIKAARAGKHVLCEKPMEVSSEKCQAMIAECKKAGRQLAIGYRCQFEPHHLECVRLAREKVLGQARIIEAGFGFQIGNPNQWRLRRELSGGGALMDVGIYALQSARMLTGEEPITVAAMETKTDPVKFKEVDESMTWEMKFPGGVLAYCSTTYKLRGINRFTVFADEGSFGLDPAYNYGGIRGRRSDGAELRYGSIDQFAAEMDDFAQCILSNKPSKVSGEEGLRDVSIMKAIYEAARTGTTVELA